MKKLALIALMPFVLLGCATVNMAPASQDAAAKTFTTKPAVAGVYIYRNEILGSAIHMDVSMDGKKLGQTVSKTYIYTEVQPGPHHVVGEAENTSTLDFDAAAGQLYYVWQEVKMGVMYARNQLHLVNAQTGQAGVMESKLVAQP